MSDDYDIDDDDIEDDVDDDELLESYDCLEDVLDAALKKVDRDARRMRAWER